MSYLMKQSMFHQCFSLFAPPSLCPSFPLSLKKNQWKKYSLVRINNNKKPQNNKQQKPRRSAESLQEQCRAQQDPQIAFNVCPQWSALQVAHRALCWEDTKSHLLAQGERMLWLINNVCRGHRHEQWWHPCHIIFQPWKRDIFFKIQPSLILQVPKKSKHS